MPKETALLDREGRPPRGPGSPLTVAGRHCRAIVERAAKEFGKLDVLVNNAAYQMTLRGIDEISDDGMGQDLPHQHLQHVLPVEGGGAAHEAGRAIINTSSINANMPQSEVAALMRPPRVRSRISLPDWPRSSPSMASGSTASRRGRSGRR